MASPPTTVSISSTIMHQSQVPSSKRHKQKKKSYVVFGTVKHLYANYNHKLKTINRCGMILYYDAPDSVPLESPIPNGDSLNSQHQHVDHQATNLNNSSKSTNQRTFVFAVDRRTRELTDTGGGVLPTDNSLISTAIRETREESLGIFDELLPLQFKFNEFSVYERAWAITDFKTLIIFWKIDPIDQFFISQEFRKRVTGIKCPEVIGVEWVNTDQLETLLFPKHRRQMARTRIGGLADCPCNLIPNAKSFTSPAGCIRLYDKVLRLLQSAGTNFQELP